MFLNIGARTEARLHLRVLATSDLHAALWPYDYVTDTARPTGGLAMLASAIADHRAGVANCLVLDNGDTYEGTPLADLAAKNALEPHPMVVAMNAIGYDAAVPGNHDFNYGLDALDQIVSRAAFPMVLSNIGRRDGRPLLARSVVLTREMTDIAGHRHTLRIGIVGVAPPLLVDFEGTPVSRVLAAEAMVPAARRELQRLRSDEAIDVAVVLCHGGIDHDAAEDAGENPVVPIAATGLADVIVAGHTHETFPGCDAVGAYDGDDGQGTVKGVPVVQPGAHGEHLGIVDLEFAYADGAWHRTGGRGTLVSASPGKPHAEVLSLTAGAHAQTQARMRTEIGRTDAPLASYFDTLAPSRVVSLTAAAQRARASALLQGHRDRALPILAAVAPLRAGAPAGQHSVTDIATGPLELRHSFDMYPYANRMVVLKVTGDDLRRWLEESAHIFAHIRPGQRGQTLLDRRVASYNFDVMAGVTYDIDVTEAPLPPGGQGPGRIRNLSHAGRPIGPGDGFLVVTSSYRAGGGGGFVTPRAAEVVLEPGIYLREVLVDYIQAQGRISPAADTWWRFARVGGASAVAQLDPGATAHLDTADGHGLRYLGLSEDGEAEFEVTL